MKIIPQGAPAQQQGAQSDFNKAQATRQRAIAALMGQKPGEGNAQPTTQVVSNQSAVQPEEMGAIIPTPNLQPEPTAPVEASSPTTEETPVEQPKPDPQLSNQFAKLARQERALRAQKQQQDQAFSAREAELKAREARLQEIENDYKTNYVPKSLAKQDPLGYLAQADLSYDEITQQVVNPQQTDPRILNHITKLEEKIKSLESKTEEVDKGIKSQQQAAYDSALKQIRNDINSLVKQGDQYETIRATNSHKDVEDLIVKTFNEDGEIMTVEEACELVENHLLEEVTKLSRLGKVQKRLAPADTKPAVPEVKKTQPPETGTQTQPQTKTLNNKMSSNRPLSAKERAILAFQGKLS